jgi:hypothetical protein
MVKISRRPTSMRNMSTQSDAGSHPAVVLHGTDGAKPGADVADGGGAGTDGGGEVVAEEGEDQDAGGEQAEEQEQEGQDVEQDVVADDLVADAGDHDRPGVNALLQLGHSVAQEHVDADGLGAPGVDPAIPPMNMRAEHELGAERPQAIVG